jgi:hypothetical protein
MVFEITAPSATPTIVLGVIALFMLVLGLGFGALALSLSNPSIQVSDAGLQLSIPLYGRTIPLGELDIAAGKVVNLDDHPDIKPRIRTNGIGLPGYRMGWYRLVNGEKALLAVTSFDRTLYLPTHNDYAVLVSLDDATSALGQLQKAAE